MVGREAREEQGGGTVCRALQPSGGGGSGCQGPKRMSRENRTEQQARAWHWAQPEELGLREEGVKSLHLWLNAGSMTFSSIS